MTVKQDSTIRSKRKTGCNINKFGSVRKINGKVYIDFMYLEERVRESSKLPWNKNNEKTVRRLLNKIEEAILSETFRFAETFPLSKKKDYFTEKEEAVFGRQKTPETVRVTVYIWHWYDRLKGSGRVTERTLLGYKSHIVNYLEPFFGNMMFSDLNKSTIDKLVVWARNRRLKNKTISNKTVNKILVPLKMICTEVAIEYDWGASYNPFFGFKKLPEEDSYEKLSPFSLGEQSKLIQALSGHWKPFFETAFTIGLRQGEQLALKPGDIDWGRELLQIKRAVTKDEKGKFMMGKTKNKFSRRTIKLQPAMLNALQKQKVVYEQFQGEYFFCSPWGSIITNNYLLHKVWKPAMEIAGLKYRAMKQTRHSFATNALSCGENPLWIARVMGHRDTDMIIRVYSKYVENTDGIQDGSRFSSLFEEAMGA